LFHRRYCGIRDPRRRPLDIATAGSDRGGQQPHLKKGFSSPGGGFASGRRTEQVVSMLDNPVTPTGKEIRLTEYAACAG
jgi:hypothetical protein